MNTGAVETAVEGREARDERQNPRLTREKMIQVLWRGFGSNGSNPQGFREFLESRSDEQLGQMVEMLTATEATNCQERELVAPQFQDHVAAELARARELHGKIIGAHDGYARILEEMDELWDEVRKKEEHRLKGAMYSELVQMGAMCQRMAEDLDLLERGSETANQR